MASRKIKQATLALGLAVVAILAGLYFYTDIGKNFVADIFDKSLQQPGHRSITLMSPFKSGMSVSEASEILERQQLTVEATKNFVPKVNKVPAKNLDTLTALSFSHYGVDGKVTLEFLNNQLYEIVFNPYNPQEYVPIARNKLGLRGDPRKNGRSEVVTGNRRIASNIFLAVTEVGKSLHTKPYVIWQDLHLLTLRRQ